MRSILPRTSLAALLFFSSAAFAQEGNKSQGQSAAQDQQPQPVPAKDSVIHKKTVATVLTGLVFAPRLHYYGRTDELKSNAVLPLINVEFDSIGIYASGTGVFLNNKIQTLDYAGTIAELGYKFGNYNKGLSGNIYGNKFFYTTTQLPQSALEEQAGTNLSYAFKYFKLTATGSAAFSKERTDFFTSAGINKTFKKVYKKSVLLITPTYVMNAGSQNFTNVNNKANSTGPLITEDVYEQNRQFKILDHEISVPIIYARKHLYLIATPSYIRPENVIEVPNHPELSETAQNLFYVNLTVIYSFKFYK